MNKQQLLYFRVFILFKNLNNRYEIWMFFILPLKSGLFWISLTYNEYMYPKSMKSCYKRNYILFTDFILFAPFSIFFQANGMNDVESMHEKWWAARNAHKPIGCSCNQLPEQMHFAIRLTYSHTNILNFYLLSNLTYAWMNEAFYSQCRKIRIFYWN